MHDPHLTEPPAHAVALLDRQPATAADLAPLAFAGYAHFTAMQVRAGRVRGLDLHLHRLRTASLAMFGQALPDDRVRAALRAALPAEPQDLSLVATIHSTASEFTVADPDAGLRCLVRTGPPASGPAGPLRLDLVEHERTLPGIKHVGEVAKTWFLRQAAARGFDDAAFADRRGRISEATIWNLAFWDGRGVVWPQADLLRGVTMGILVRQLERLGVPQCAREITRGELPGWRGAVVMNSWTPGVAVRGIGAAVLPDAPEFLSILRQAYAAEPPVAP